MAARSVGGLLRIEVAARRRLAAAEAAAAPLAAAAAAPAAGAPRRVLPTLLTEELIRSLAAAARDTDGETRRAVMRALGLLRLTRPALLRDVVQAGASGRDLGLGAGAGRRRMRGAIDPKSAGKRMEGGVSAARHAKLRSRRSHTPTSG